jgi:hypothetical protein
LHLVQVLRLILAVEEIRIPLDDDLLEKVLSEMLLNQVPNLLGVTLQQRHCLEDLVNGHVKQAVLRWLQLFEIL